MAFVSQMRELFKFSSAETEVSSRVENALREQTELFCAASDFSLQTQRLTELLSVIWLQRSDQVSKFALASWVGMIEQDADLRLRFQRAWKSMLASLNSVPFFSEAGLPAQHALVSEITRRIFQRLLPSPREDTDAARLFAAIFASPRVVQRFLDVDAALFARQARIFWDEHNLAAFPRLRADIYQALRLLAARISGRGTSIAVRERSAAIPIEQSPFYTFVFATEKFIDSEETEPPLSRMERWLEAVYACRGQLALVRLNMEEAGVSTALVFDLSAIDASLDRMELLAATLMEHTHKLSVAARMLLNTLVCGLAEDTHVTPLIQQNLNLLARKTVERTGHGGEHYIAHTRWEYLHMWGAAIGGGLLTVFTAAGKLHIIGREWPPFIEAVLIGTTYAISFLLLNIFGLALATKQPSMTAATLADIIRRNRGDSRRDKIADFGASISRTQLAAALGNIFAVCSGAIVFDQIWRYVYHGPYVPAQQAASVSHSLSPLASATAIDAALTGILLWLAGLIGGWCENFAVFHRIPSSIAQHPLGHRIGDQRMRRLANLLDRNIAAWSTSISLGYLMGFTPVIAEFFGLPLDIRHVTLNTGMFAFAAASIGSSSFSQVWLYTAMIGIVIMFVLNLGVSFAVASYVALRAYDVSRREHLSILRYVFKQVVHSPLQFLFPLRAKSRMAEHPAESGVQPTLVPAKEQAEQQSS